MVGLSYLYPDVQNPPASAREAGDMSLIPGSGRSLGGENGNLSQYSCQWKISVDRGAWRATIHGIAKSWT